MVKFGQLQQARNLVSQGGTFLQFFVWTPTPYNLFTYKYESETESGRVSNSNSCQHGGGGGGNKITNGFFGQIFSWCNLFTLFISKKSSKNIS